MNGVLLKVVPSCVDIELQLKITSIIDESVNVNIMKNKGKPKIQSKKKKKKSFVPTNSSQPKIFSLLSLED